jgi:predicted nucleic acid-binding protein
LTIAYFDSSAFVKLLLEEDESEAAAALWDGTDSVVSSRLAYPEVAAALSAARRNARLTKLGEQRARHDWDEFWADTRVVELTTDIAADAAALATTHTLGGADAVHLASALVLSEADLLFACWDQRLRTAATEAGLRVVPA